MTFALGLVYYRVVCGVVLFPYGRSQKPQEFLTVKTRLIKRCLLTDIGEEIESVGTNQ